MKQRVVCDASAGFDVLLAGTAGRRVEAALADAEVHVPALFALEICAAARSRVRTGQLPLPRATQLIDVATHFPAIVWDHHPTMLRRCWALRDNVTTYDATYVALAEQLGATLVTADGRLADATRRFAECQVVDPHARS